MGTMDMRKERMIIGLVIGGVILNGWWWSTTIPYDGAPDEYVHYKIPKFYVENGRLPVFLKDQDMSESCRANGVDCGTSYSILPNYGYMVNALIMSVTGQKNYQGARWGNILMGAVFTLVAYLVGRMIFKEDPLMRITVTAISALMPMFTFISAYVNSDMAGLVAGTLVLWFCLKIISKANLIKTELVFGGVCLGLLALSRYNQYPMFLLVPWTFYIWKIKFNKKWDQVLKNIVLVGLVGAIVSGWWFARSWMLYGDVLGNATLWKHWWTFSTRLAPREMGIGFTELLTGWIYGNNFLATSFMSFIGSFGYMTIWYPRWFYLSVVGILCAAGVGLVKAIREVWGKGVVWEERKYSFWFWVGMGIVSIITVLLSAWSSWVNQFQPQGRYLFVFYYPFVAGLVFGITHLLRSKTWGVSSAVFLVGLFMVANIWGRQMIVSAGGGG